MQLTSIEFYLAGKIHLINTVLCSVIIRSVLVYSINKFPSIYNLELLVDLVKKQLLFLYKSFNHCSYK